MKKFGYVCMIVLLCAFCFAFSPADTKTDGQPLVIAQSSAEQEGSGDINGDVLESGNYRQTPVFYFLISISALIVLAAGAVLVRNMIRKRENT
ncbi:MAG: hypothetical protein FWH03_01425 [Firmicutes bacterium]|nr:hypothetical protein [Bacillota bacterium]